MGEDAIASPRDGPVWGRSAGIIVQTLHSHLVSGFDVDSFLNTAEALLLDEQMVTRQLATAEAPWELAANTLAELTTLVRGAFTSFPVIAKGTGFHSGLPDERPHALYATFSELPLTEFYLPDELKRISDQRPGTGRWKRIETLRLTTVLIALQAAIQALVEGRMTAGEYRRTVREIGTRLRGVRIAGS